MYRSIALSIYQSINPIDNGGSLLRFDIDETISPPTNLLIYQARKLPTYRSINLPIYSSNNLPTYQSIDLPTYPSINVWTYQSNYQTINRAMYRINALSIYRSIGLLDNGGSLLMSSTDGPI